LLSPYFLTAENPRLRGDRLAPAEAGVADVLIEKNILLILSAFSASSVVGEKCRLAANSALPFLPKEV